MSEEQEDRRQTYLALGRRIEAFLRKRPPGFWIARKDLAAILDEPIQSVTCAVEQYYGVLDLILCRAAVGDRGKAGFVRLKPDIDTRYGDGSHRYKAMVNKLWRQGVRDISSRKRGHDG